MLGLLIIHDNMLLSVGVIQLGLFFSPSDTRAMQMIVLLSRLGVHIRQPFTSLLILERACESRRQVGDNTGGGHLLILRNAPALNFR